MDPIVMYETLGPIKSNGRMTVQLTATSSKEDALKFNELLEQQADKAVQASGRPAAETARKPEAEKRSEQPAEAKEEPQEAEEDPKACFDRMVKEGVIVPVGYLVSEGPVEETHIAQGEEQIVGPVGEQIVQPVYEAIETEEAVAPGQDGVLLQPEQADVQPQPERAETETAAQTAEEPVRDEAPAQTAPQAEVRTQEQPERPEAAAEAVQTRTEAPVEEQGDETVAVEYGEAKPEPVFHDVQAAPVKVGETVRESRTEETPDVERQLDSGLAQALEQGESRVELQLTPEHLGTVKVEITRTGEGTVRIALSAQSGETRSLLEKHTDGLRAALGSRTQSEVQVEVRKDEGSQRRDDHPYEGHNGQNRQQQERRHREQPGRTEDFLQQLRLGLIPSEDAQE